MKSYEELLSIFSENLKEIHSSIGEQFVRKGNGKDQRFEFTPEPQLDTFLQFLTALPLSEWWLQCMLGFHITCLITIFFTRQHHNIQYVTFFTLLLLVGLSEKVNEYAAQHWKLFAKENCFDSNGLFISTVYSTPILLNAVVFIILWLKEASSCVIALKKRQLSEKKENEDSATLEKEERDSKSRLATDTNKERAKTKRFSDENKDLSKESEEKQENKKTK